MPLQLYEKDQILESCFDVYVHHGYMNTSTAMLAEAAGISKALIFHHFKSKKDLYIEIVERCFDKMASEISHEPSKVYKDYFEAKEQSGMHRVEYLRKNPKINKLLFEAFYSTPTELKDEIKKFRIYIEDKYKAHNNTANEQIKKLFSEISFKDNINPKEACELINIVSEYFRMKLASELTNDEKLLGDIYWDDFFDKKGRFLNMIRYGIEKEEWKHE